MATETNRTGLSTFGRAFWRATLDRAVKTAAQVPLTTWVAGDVVMNVFSMDWTKVAGLALGGFIVSVLTSIASAPVGPVDSPSTI
jgi:hypothetical protein